MTAPIVNLYSPADGTTEIATLTSARDIRCAWDLTGAGDCTFTYDPAYEAAGDVAAADAWVVLEDAAGTRLWAGVVRELEKVRLDNNRAEVFVTAYGLRAMLDDAYVAPANASGYGLDGTRYFGWATSGFDDSEWTVPASHGTWASDPWGDQRPSDWPAAPDAEMIWTAVGDQPAGACHFRKAFYTAQDVDVTVLATADDEAVVYVDGVEVVAVEGLYRWRDYVSTSLRLSAGEHTFAIKGTNADRGGDTPAWVMGAIVRADPSSAPTETDETWEVHTAGAFNGTFTLTFDDFDETAPIAYDATAAQVKAALEATSPTLAVSVTGAGTTADPWVIVADGATQSGRAHALTGDPSGLSNQTLSITNTVDGDGADTFIKTDTTWRHLAYPSTVPGQNPGQILQTVLTEAQDRGCLTGLTWTFDGDLDAEGQPWTTELNLAVGVGETVHQVVRVLEDAGCDVRIDGDGVILAAEDLGSDMSATAVIDYGVNATGLRHVRDGVRWDRLLTETASGYATVNASITGAPRREGYVSAGDFPDQASFAAFAAELLRTYEVEGDVTHATLDEHVDASVEPITAFHVGDRVNLVDFKRSPALQRVLSINASWDNPQGTARWVLEAVREDDIAVGAQGLMMGGPGSGVGGHMTADDRSVVEAVGPGTAGTLKLAMGLTNLGGTKRIAYYETNVGSNDGMFYTDVIPPTVTGDWTYTGYNPGAEITDFASDGATLIAVGPTAGAHKSTDGGITWTALSDGGPSHLIAYRNGLWVRIQETATNAQYAVWTSTDGTNWTDRGPVVTGMSGVNDIAVGADGQTIMFCGGAYEKPWRSTDGGATWAEGPFPINPTVVNAIASGPDGTTEWVAVDGAGQVFHSTDNGDTWTEQHDSVENGERVEWDKDLWIATFSDAVIATSPDGVTWTEQTVTEVTDGSTTADIEVLEVFPAPKAS